MNPEKHALLVVDDQKVNRVLLSKMLSDEYNILEAENGQQAIELLPHKDYAVSAILLDLTMPVMDGYEFLRRIKGTQLEQTPVIVLTGSSDERQEERVLALGAWDFISKPYQAAVLKFRIQNAISRSMLASYDRLKYLAQIDPLTGLYNKNHFFEATRELLNLNPDRRFVFVRFDIEKFKLVNTFFGEKEGDNILVAIAGWLRGYAKNVQGPISYGRLEADAFGVCMTYPGEREFLAQIELARARLRAYKIGFDLVPAVGVYVVGDPSMRVTEMCDRAILAADACKGNYIKSYAFYTPEMSNSIIREQMIVNRMQAALKNGEFEVWLQPQYDLRTNEIAGAEALVRWRDPERGVIAPSEFIPVFERNGFIGRLDHYVWRSVCQMLRRWLDCGRQVLPVSVNVSRASLYNPKMTRVITDMTEKYAIPPRLLQLELTESAYTTNPQGIRDAMKILQEQGFSILMDDFGSGYSSLNVLKDIAVDILKIDMRFMSESEIKGRGENILASVVRMAKWLNMPVIAEGVETERQANFLRGIGCEYAQGFYFAKPMPVEQYEQLTANGRAFTPEKDKPMAIAPDSLWDSAAQMELLLSNMPQAVVLYEMQNGQAQILRVNQAYYELFDRQNLSFVKGDALQDTADEEFLPILRKAFQQAETDHTAVTCEFVRTVGQRRRWIYLTLKCVAQVGGRNILLGVAEDVTGLEKSGL